MVQAMPPETLFFSELQLLSPRWMATSLHESPKMQVKDAGEAGQQAVAGSLAGPMRARVAENRKPHWRCL